MLCLEMFVFSIDIILPCQWFQRGHIVSFETDVHRLPRTREWVQQWPLRWHWNGFMIVPMMQFRGAFFDRLISLFLKVP